jgi:putative ATP-dependent endonuclease of OLD family
VFDSGNRRRLNIDDFCRYIDVSQYFELDDNGDLVKQAPPKIKISVTIKESTGDHAENELHGDTIVVFDWRTEVGPPYEARLIYEFFLPQGSDTKSYSEAIKNLIEDEEISSDEYWSLLRRNFIRKYIARIYCGDEVRIPVKSSTESDPCRPVAERSDAGWVIINQVDDMRAAARVFRCDSPSRFSR